ncbi:MAG: ATP-binding cassette domain-containing protein [Desulfotomaculales bacterium]
MPVLEAHNLVKVYNGVRALDGLTFEVQEGEVFGFLGPNGAGKSTAIRILTTLTRPTAGTARVAGWDILRRPRQVRQSIGYVPQEVSLDHYSTGRENLVLFGRLYRLTPREARRRAAELLALMELEDAADRLVVTYSGGMKKRLDIATGLVHRPRLLFLDEPTTGLDPYSRVRVWDYIRRLNREEGITIFLTTHYLEEADRLAHRVAILDRGRIVAEGAPDALKDAVGGDVVQMEIDAEPAAAAGLEAALAALPGVRRVHVGERHVRVVTVRGPEAVPALFRRAEGAGFTVRAVTVARPSLDDVFFYHTGRTMAEAQR